MPYLLSLFLVLIPFTVNADIYTWKDESGVTHFAQEKPDNENAHSIEVDTQKPTTTSTPQAQTETQLSDSSKKIEANPALLTQEHKLASEFLLGQWSGFSKATTKEQLWVFKKDGFFSIKQAKNATEYETYSGQWELDYEDILLSINFKASENNGEKTSGFVAIENAAEIIENTEGRILISFNEEEFWLSRD